jgi:hypothetical protein
MKMKLTPEETVDAVVLFHIRDHSRTKNSKV